jgi:hypothetical protein
MKDFIERVLFVLNWRSRSMWMLVVFLLATVFFGYVATGALERFLEIGGPNGSAFYKVFQPIFKYVYVFFLIMSFLIPICVFIKDWKAFHKRW